MFRRRRSLLSMKKIIIVSASCGLFGLVIILYFCGSNLCSDHRIPVLQSKFSSILEQSGFESYKLGMLPYNKFNRSDLGQSMELNIENEDVIVFLHIQKTGGTAFGKHLVKHLDLELPCKCVRKRKRCDCYTSKRTIWLFSRYSTGWACGLHADWTELTTCVEDAMNKKEKKERQRRYHYITIIRDPVKRYLSEWKHVQRGATWKTAKLFCNGRSATLEEMPRCYEDEDWMDVTLDNFLQCQYNLARNRQTRMLANLTLINCYNATGQDPEIRDQIMLKSAKENLLKMDYFGLTEFQKYSQHLFEHTFNLQFKETFTQLPVTHSDKTHITEIQKSLILEQNKLDIELYTYAKDLFLQRVSEMKRHEKDYSGVHDYEPDKDRFDDSVDIAEDDDDEEDTEDYHGARLAE